MKYAKSNGIDGIIPNGTLVSLVMTCADQMDEYPISADQVVHTFQNVKALVSFIGGELGITGKIYVNSSPYAGFMECIN